MPRKQISFPLQFLMFLILTAAIASLFSFCAVHGQNQQTLNNAAPGKLTVVLDAGHGGEDGGAVSASGLYEKDLNLAIAEKLKILLEANGMTVIMTRETDILLYDRNSDYHGHKKVQDLATRRRIAEEHEDAVFVSIHMNAYPLSQYSGLQIWYSPNHPHSKLLAEEIQTTVREELQPENDRHIKSATSSIYLLHHLKSPAVLIECGFLSNEEEAALLADEKYQATLAQLIFVGILSAQEKGA